MASNLFRMCLFNKLEISNSMRNSKRIILPNLLNENLFSKLKESKQDSFSSETNKSQIISEDDEPPLPKILSLQNPYTSFMNKFDMKLLQSVWDPTFNQHDFIRGSKKAVSRVTQLASEGKTSDLHGLISRQLLMKLKEELSFSDTKKLWPYLGLKPTNVVVARPRRVLFQKMENKRFSNIDVMFAGMKWLTHNRTADGLLYMEMFARFRREYTLYCIPNWTIIAFLITKCDVIARVPRL